METKYTQQIEKQNETKIESQSVPITAHHKKINRNMKTKANIKKHKNQNKVKSSS